MSRPNRLVLAAATLAAVSLIADAQPVFAQRAPDPASLTCAAAQNYVLSRGRANWRTGPNSFEQVVASVENCIEPQSRIVPVRSGTKDDANCTVGYICVQPRRGGNK